MFLLLLGAAAFPQNTSPSEWDHNGSVVNLIKKDSSLEFYYKKPRQGMLDAGAHEGSLLFRGESKNGRYEGTAYLFDRRCGPTPYRVSGSILDNEERIVLTGMAPRLGRNCRIQGSFENKLEFKLLKTLEVTSPQTQASTNPNPSASGPPPSSAQIQPSTNPNPSANGPSPTESILPLNQKVPDTSKAARSPDDTNNLAAVQPVPQATPNDPKGENQKNIKFMLLFWLIPLGGLLGWLSLWLIFRIYKAVKSAG